MTRIARRRVGAALALILLWLATACGGSPAPTADAPSQAETSAATVEQSPTPEAPSPVAPSTTPAAELPLPPEQVPAAAPLPLPNRPLPMPSPSVPENPYEPGVVLWYKFPEDGEPELGAERRLTAMMPSASTGRTLDGEEAVDYARSVAVEFPQAAGTVGAVPVVAGCLSELAIPAVRAVIDDEQRGVVVVLIAEFAEHTLPGGLPHCFSNQVYPGGMDGACLARYHYDVGPPQEPRSQWVMVIGTGEEYCQWARQPHSHLSPEDLNL